MFHTTKELHPVNPRIYYLEGKSTMFKPAFLGGGFEVALPILEKSLQYYGEFVLPFDIYPHWGEEETLSLYQECKDKIEEK